ncbi:MAG: hypothetical protein AABM33_06995 [Pseudomonadota bacterium]
MKKLAIAVTLAAGLGIGSLAAVQARLPPAPPKSDAEKAAEAEKAAAAKAKETELNDKAMDKAVANYKKNKGIVDPKVSAATTSGKK